MPKTDIAYGKSYRPCPCAQITDFVTAERTFYHATCYSPKRQQACKFTDVDQARICMGGTSHGKRYTQCPYYVKNAQIRVAKRTRKSSRRVLSFYLGRLMIFWLIAYVCITSGEQYGTTFGFMFFVVGIMMGIVPLFAKDEIVDVKKRK